MHPDGHDFADILHQVHQIERHCLGRKFSRLHFGHVQDMIDQFEQKITRIGNDMQEFFLLVVQRGGPEKIGHAYQGVERRADFMAHVPQQLAFGFIGSLSGLDGPLRFLVAFAICNIKNSSFDSLVAARNIVIFCRIDQQPESGPIFFSGFKFGISQLALFLPCTSQFRKSFRIHKKLPAIIFNGQQHFLWGFVSHQQRISRIDVAHCSVRMSYKKTKARIEEHILIFFFGSLFGKKHTL